MENIAKTVKRVLGLLIVVWLVALCGQIQAKTLTLRGQKPGEAIIKTATEEGANVIVMGSRGLGKIRRTLMGSVSEYVTHHAPAGCAVVILRDA